MRNLYLYRVLLAPAAVAAPALAFAHDGAHQDHDLVHGFIHPLAGIDHVLAMVAVPPAGATRPDLDAYVTRNSVFDN